MNSAVIFPAHLLSISERNEIGQNEVKHLFALVESNGGWENNMARGKKLGYEDSERNNSCCNRADEQVRVVIH